MGGIKMSQVNLQIEGMHCGACVRRVNQSLQSISGIKDLEVRVGGARFEAEQEASVEQAITAISNAGYTARQEN